MKIALIRLALAAGTLGAVATTAFPQPASADAGSTAAIAAAALIVGGLIYDSSRHQYYYQRGGRHVYVDNNTASYYRNHGGKYRGPEGQWHGNGYHDNHHGH